MIFVISFALSCLPAMLNQPVEYGYVLHPCRLTRRWHACRQSRAWASMMQLWRDAERGSHSYASTSEPAAVAPLSAFSELLRRLQQACLEPFLSGFDAQPLWCSCLSTACSALHKTTGNKDGELFDASCRIIYALCAHFRVQCCTSTPGVFTIHMPVS